MDELPDAAAVDDPPAAALEVWAAADADDDDDDAPELHPTISATIAAIATPPAAMRTRLSLCMVLTAPLTGRPMARDYIAGYLGERSSNITIGDALAVS